MPAALAAVLIDRFREIRTLPHIVARLTQLVNDQESTLQDFEAVIRLDLGPGGLAVDGGGEQRLVRPGSARWTPSPGPWPCSARNPQHRHHRRGPGMLCHRSGSAGFSPVRLWLHSAASGICGKMIAERIFAINGDDAYLCGILHDIGLIVELETSAAPFFELMDRLAATGPTIVDLERESRSPPTTARSAPCSRGNGRSPNRWPQPSPTTYRTDSVVAPQSPDGILQMSEYLVHQLGHGVKEGDPGRPRARAGGPHPGQRRVPGRGRGPAGRDGSNQVAYEAWRRDQRRSPPCLPTSPTPAWNSTPCASISKGKLTCSCSFCRDEAGRHTASAAFPLNEDETARPSLPAAGTGSRRSEPRRAGPLPVVPELRCTVLAATAPGMPAGQAPGRPS